MNRPPKPSLLFALVLGVALGAATAADAPAPRIVSLNPSLTAILLALDAGESLVGVDAYSARTQPEVESLPRVGGLFNPSLEAIVSLRPDFVALVPSAQQRNLAERLAALEIEVLSLQNVTFDQVLENIEVLGERASRSRAAAARIAAIREAWTRVSRRTAPLDRVRAVLVLQRDPLFIVGHGSFIDAMLRAAGVENLGAEFAEPYPRAANEWLVERRPELILDASEGGDPLETHWSRWPSLPAVKNGRVVSIPAPLVTLPGPELDRALRILVEAIHGPDFLSGTALGESR